MTDAFKPFDDYIRHLALGDLDGYLDSINNEDKFTFSDILMSQDPDLLLHDLGKGVNMKKIKTLFSSGTVCVFVFDHRLQSTG